MKRFFSGLGRGLFFALLFVALQFAVSFVGMLVISIPLALAAGGENTLDFSALTQQVSAAVTEYANLLSMVSNILTVAVIIIIFAATKRRFHEQVRLFRAPLKKLWIVLVFSAAMTLVVTSLLELLPFNESMVTSYQQLSGTLSKGNPIIAFIGVVIVAPIAEEIVFRGLVYTRFKEGMPLIIALILECAIFGLLHGTAIWIAYAFLLGVVMTLVFEAYGTILASILFHITFNLLGTYVVPYISFSSPWYPLIGGLIAAGACAVFMGLWRGRRRVVDGE